MNWTTHVPSVEGRYWFTAGLNKPALFGWVLKCPRTNVLAFSSDSGKEDTLKNLRGGWWFGPVKSPPFPYGFQEDTCMTWTTNLPTVEGHYWMARGKQVHLVLVYSFEKRADTVCFHGNTNDKPLKALRNSRWIGPLEAPVPPDIEITYSSQTPKDL